jgi:hypothetical protein
MAKRLLMESGLSGDRLIILDACLELTENAIEVSRMVARHEMRVDL